MTLDHYQAGSPEIEQWRDSATDQSASLALLEQWVRGAQAANEVATQLCKSSFVPTPFRNKPEEATAAILTGMELGFSPMGSLRAFDVIQGYAAPKAITHRAVVQARGHEIWVVEETPTRAVVQGRRKGSDKVEESVWTIERARQMDLLSKDQWKKQPTAMLVARATSECARFVASDALLGMPYSAEEVLDGGIAATRVASKRGERGVAPEVSVDDLTGTALAAPEPAAKAPKFSAAKTKRAIAAATSRDDLTAIYQGIPAESFTADIRDALSARAEQLTPAVEQDAPVESEPSDYAAGAPDPSDDPWGQTSLGDDQ